MKKHYTFLILLFTVFVGNAQIVNIPDANFKARLLAASPSNTIAKNAIGQNIKIDINNDGEIQVSEALNVYQLYVINFSIQNLIGIEAFSNLTTLKCNSNQLTSLNLSQNTALQYLDCSSNQLTSLNVTLNNSLNYLKCSYNQLLNINVTQNTVLIEFNCNNNRLTNLDVTQNNSLQFLRCSTNQLTSLDVTQNTALKEFYCYSNQLTNIDVTQNTALTIFDCGDNQFTNLDVTQNTDLLKFYCSLNQLTSLDVSQNTALEIFWCASNQLENLIMTPSLELTEFSCRYNQLTALNITQNPNLVTFECHNNLLTELNITQNPNLDFINCSYNQLTNIDFSNNLLLQQIYCRNNQLTFLDVSNQSLLYGLNCHNSSLNSIILPTNQSPNAFPANLICSNNLIEVFDLSNFKASYVSLSDNPNLVSINTKNNQNDNIFINNTPSLQYICVDEQELSTLGSIFNNVDLSNIEINSYCSFEPGGTFYTIQGNNKFDSNSNGCDATDLNIPNQKFNITNGSISGAIIADQSGTYSIPVQSGSHTITPVFENPSYFTVSPASATVSFPATASPATRNFCITANGVKNDLEVTIIPIGPARPGFDAHYRIIYKNKGNQVSNGSLNFTFDDAIMDLVSATPVNDNAATNSLSWNYTNLNPFETREIDLVFNINSPMETPAVNGDDVLDYIATIVGATDQTPNDNTFTLNQTVVNSYDPNDKTCLEGATITPSMVGQYVHYVIRFENTGTFAAQNIVVKDMIDTTKFDVSTLIPQHSSHDFFTRINGNKVEFIFENINLPFDDANNDGYVAFKIKTKPTLVLGNTFTNSASIYFDYNFPIVTDPAVTTVALLNTNDFDFGTYFTLYPNPAKDVLNFGVKNEIGVKSVSVYNTLGQIVMAITNVDNLKSIDVSGLTAGSYFVKVYTDKGSSSSKFIKQ